MLKTMRRHGITLALFAAGATGLTAVVNSLTENTIAHQAALQQKHCWTKSSRQKIMIMTCKQNVTLSLIQPWVIWLPIACTLRVKVTNR